MSVTYLYDASACEAALLRTSMLAGNSAAPEAPFPIFSPLVLTYAKSLEVKGFGTTTGSLEDHTACFTPSARAAEWLCGEPLTEVEIFVLGYFANIPLGDFEQHRDAGLGYPEFREAAHGLQVRGFGTYHPDAVDEVDPYFVISPAGLAEAQSRATRVASAS